MARELPRQQRPDADEHDHREQRLQRAAPANRTASLGFELPAEDEEVEEQHRRGGDHQQVEREEDVDERLRRPAGASLSSGDRAAGGDRHDGDGAEHAHGRQQGVAAVRARLHRRVRRASVEERLQRPAVMGIVNVTPDSFSDGGVHLDPAAVAAAARRMVEEGAAIVDVGGESTRPGSAAVTVEEELRRVLPVLERLDGVPFSIDTAKSGVARRALELGAELVNDVTALRGDPELAGVVADAGCYVCLMHMRGEPRTMQADPQYDAVVSQVAGFLEERLAFAVEAGIAEDRVCLDPGIGFGKTAEHNFELIRRLDAIAALGRPVLIGLSRKSSFGRLFDPDARTGTLAASIGAAVAAYDRGASIFRVHDVREHVQALTA